MNPLRALLMPAALKALSQRYRGYRRQRTPPLTAALHCLLVALGWALLRFESAQWQQVSARQRQLYPHISPERPRPADALRYLIQSLWLLLVLPLDASARSERQRLNAFSALARWRRGFYRWLNRLPQRAAQAKLEKRGERWLSQLPPLLRRALFTVAVLLATALALLCISQPFDIWTQFIFVMVLWAVAMVVRRIPGRLPIMMMIVLSLTISCRYLWWRYTATLNWNDPLSLTFGVLLIAAETYSWVVLLLGYFQSLWPLQRKPLSMPEDVSSWPAIDLLVPTWNEPLSVVKPTIYAALGLDWPREKLNIYLLDDGRRPEFRAFAESVG
ncbi:UDP-forming cellulose synthase catalytic subunit, partial [Erwinia sp. OLMDLW33]